MADETGSLETPGPEKGVGWYVYGVISWSVEVPVTAGIEEGRPTAFIPEGPIMAVASPVSLAVFDSEPLRRNMEDPRWLAEKVCQHEAVVEAMMARGPVLPMKFCTIFRSPDAVRRMLREHAPRFQEALDFVRDKEEWGVKGFVNPAALRGAVLRNDPPLLALSRQATVKPPGQAFFLKRKIEEGASLKSLDREQELAHDAREAIRGTVVDLTEPSPGLPQTREGNRMLFNLACLIRREGVETFLLVVERWNRGHREEGFSLVASGPWPPYHFVPRLHGDG